MPTKTAKKTSNKLSFLKKLTFTNVNRFLAFLFYLIWVLVGLYALLVVFANIRQGALKSLFAKPPSQETSQAPQAPVETTIPGIGKVNIECIQSSLTPDEIQKIVQTGDDSKLTAEEKAKLEPCIIEKAEATASPSTSK